MQESSVYQNSEASNQMKDFLIESSSLSVKLSIEIMAEEGKPKITGKIGSNIDWNQYW